MTNSDIADLLKLYADLSELHGGNPFKIKSFASASFRIDKLPTVLAGKTIAELEKVEGVGKTLAAKIFEINETESFTDLTELIAQTPEGVLQMMKIKGIGPKKIAQIWKELEIESIGELLYACKENRLAQAKGFGLKTQQNVINQIEFMFASENKFHFATAEQTARELVEELNKLNLFEALSFTGALRRKLEIIDNIELIAATAKSIDEIITTMQASNVLANISSNQHIINGTYKNVQVSLFISLPAQFAWNLFETTANAAHLQLLDLSTINKNETTETAIYASINLPYIEPELREGLHEVDYAKQNKLPQLIEYTDLKGALHNHSTWSDGLNTIAEMAKTCQQMGYSYFGIADHSKAAFYANGLDEERIINQHEEIDKLNKANSSFKIFKGTECDILYNGQLDYSNDVLATFDYVVASVHSILKMNEEKAMSRLIAAIENPYTTILGHPTGRLLLLRQGYPINHQKVIDACAANNVAIEINAHPYRLDLDWRYIDYALNKNVMLCINPDAHSIEGLKDMYYGTQIGRKGGLTAAQCLNAFDTEKLDAYFKLKK